MRESITSSEDDLIIVNPQSNEKPVNGVICLDVHSEHITLVSVWRTGCNEEQERLGDQ